MYQHHEQTDCDNRSEDKRQDSFHISRFSDLR